ncbi:MAG: helix-turn-helix transcriptional regulator [Acutalibacter sp.]|jgi:transcriptional regulator with XRE-family HTH domain
MSSLGTSLYNARKKSGLTQEEVAERLGVSRQTISKWELDETLPDIRQAKKLSELYRVSLDDLIDYDAEVQEIQRVIAHTSQATQDKIDWTKLWGQKYPVLTAYQQEVDVPRYAVPLKEMLQELEETYHYSRQDAFLVLKDILAKLWKQK